MNDPNQFTIVKNAPNGVNKPHIRASKQRNLIYRLSGLTIILVATLLAACGGKITTRDTSGNDSTRAKVGESCKTKQCISTATCNDQKVCVAKSGDKAQVGESCAKKECIDTAICRNAVCVEKNSLAEIGESCATKQCVDNANCENEVCVEQKTCTQESDECQDTQVCSDGKCIDKSQLCNVKNIECPNSNYACVDGACIPSCDPADRCGGACCADSQRCLNNQCITPPAKAEDDSDSLCPLAAGGVAYCKKGNDCFGNPTVGYSCIGVSDYECNIDEEILCKLDEYCAPGVNRCVNYEANKKALCKRDIPFSDDIEEVISWQNPSVSRAYNQVMSTPVVVNVYDNNGDGKLDEKDTSEIIFSSYSYDIPSIHTGRYANAYMGLGVLRIISGDFAIQPQDREIFSSTTATTPFWTSTSFAPAVSDINGDGKPDIISDAYYRENATLKPEFQLPSSLFNLDTDRRIVAISGSGPDLARDKQGDGKEFLFNIKLPEPLNTWEHNPLFSVANVDSAGAPEIAAGQYLLDNTGNILCNVNDLVANKNNLIIVHLADMNGDGKQELIASAREWGRDKKGIYVFSYDPTQSGANKCTLIRQLDQYISGMAIADMNEDGSPELVFNSAGTIKVYDYKNERFLWGEDGIDIPLSDEQEASSSCAGKTKGDAVETNLCRRGIAVPVVANFDNDKRPEVGIAGRYYYVVFDFPDDINAKPKILWKKGTNDSSSAKTSSSVFDFNGDGKAEVVYNDEEYLRVYSGENGNSLLEIANSNATLREYPVIADVNHDGHANIVISANSANRTAQHGIRVFKDRKNEWLPTRQIWNQFAYHVTNINQDGTVPVQEKPNWKQPWLNNYFQNVQKGNPLLVPNVRPVIKQIASSSCDDSSSTNKEIIFAIQNDGSNDVPVGKLPYKVYATNRADETKSTIASGTNTKIIKPGDSETIVLNSWSIPNGWTSFDVTFELNGGTADNLTREQYECDYSNNTATVEDIQLASANLVTKATIDSSRCIGSRGTLTINYSVSNKGKRSVSANSTNIKIYAGLTGETPKLLETIEINKELTENQKFEGSYTWSIPAEYLNRPVSVKVVADEDNSILECSEEDNTFDTTAENQQIICYNLG